MADVTKAQSLREFAETYGVAVRAGLITPNVDDERAARLMFGLPAPNESVIAEWARTNGVRAPITIAGGASGQAAVQDAQAGNNNPGA